jgi:hypothetical protein
MHGQHGSRQHLVASSESSDSADVSMLSRCIFSTETRLAGSVRLLCGRSWERGEGGLEEGGGEGSEGCCGGMTWREGTSLSLEPLLRMASTRLRNTTMTHQRKHHISTEAPVCALPQACTV